ncbi:Coenzyme F420 hydrogenase/dehydrogenase, beta subunit C-terminal domain [Proteus faecis]|uniref:Coenzyme F420 hydrogenase/dehydrogenase, beta subunit C-terminal domain n=1 Tax=Proteus faecis TaxID=2050967 RepID=UPI003075E1FC
MKKNQCNDIIKLVVNNNLCIGCGLCTLKCKNNSLVMSETKYGFYEVKKIKDCNCDGGCLDVCPFNPYPKEEIKTENEISKFFFNKEKKHHPKIGYFISTYAGYSYKHRETSSSGGIATYVLEKLLENKTIDYVISVKSSDNSSRHYEYRICSSKEELMKSSKTKYYPVTLSFVLSKINELDGNIAIVGVACFVKAIRLAQLDDPILKNRVKFIVGIICGGIKSSFFSEYLASKTGTNPYEYKKPEFRIKDINSKASDYSFGCYDKTNKQKIIKMSTVGDMWGTGLFKSNACDLCDDVTTELADISVGDAWIKPYSDDGKGNNVLITRSQLAEDIIIKGIKNNDIYITKLLTEEFLQSQQGSFTHRHNALPFRIKKLQKLGILIPPKRVSNIKIDILEQLIQKMRMRTRRKSLELWLKEKNHITFDKKMKIDLTFLKILTKLNHIKRKVIIKIKG